MDVEEPRDLLPDARVPGATAGGLGRSFRVAWESVAPAGFPERPTGRATLLGIEDARGFQVEFLGGRGVLPQGRSAPLAVLAATVEGEEAWSSDGWLWPAPDAAGEALLELTLDPWVRIVADDSGEDVGEVLRLLAEQGPWLRGDSMLPHPAGDRSRGRAQALGPSPRRRSELEHGEGALIGAEGFVWRWVAFPRALEGRQVLRLQRAGTLRLAVRARDAAAERGPRALLLALHGPFEVPVHLVELTADLDTGSEASWELGSLAPGSYRVELLNRDGGQELLAQGSVAIPAGGSARLELDLGAARGLVHVPGTIALPSADDVASLGAVRVLRLDGRPIPVQPRSPDRGAGAALSLTLSAAADFERDGNVVSWHELWLEPGAHALELDPFAMRFLFEVHDVPAEPIHLACAYWHSVTLELVRARDGDPVGEVAVSIAHLLGTVPSGPLARHGSRGRFEPLPSTTTMRIPCGARTVLGLMPMDEDPTVIVYREIDPETGPVQTLRVPETISIVAELRDRGLPLARPFDWWGSLQLAGRQEHLAPVLQIGPLSQGEPLGFDRVLLRFDDPGPPPYELHVPGLDAGGTSRHPLGHPGDSDVLRIDVGLRSVQVHRPQAR